MIRDSRFIRPLPGKGKISSVGQMQTAKRHAHDRVTYPGGALLWNSQENQASGHEEPPEASKTARSGKPRCVKGNTIKYHPRDYGKLKRRLILKLGVEQD